MELTAQDKALLETNFGEEIEKMAAERVGACQEAYAYGFSKLAAEVAEAKDEEDKKEEKKEDKKEEKMDEESEKAAAELGAFIERGFFDGLRKLGSERHDDEMHYLLPYLEEKVAGGKEKAAKGLLEKGLAKIKGGAEAAKKSVEKGWNVAKKHPGLVGGTAAAGLGAGFAAGRASKD